MLRSLRCVVKMAGMLFGLSRKHLSPLRRSSARVRTLQLHLNVQGRGRRRAGLLRAAGDIGVLLGDWGTWDCSRGGKAKSGCKVLRMLRRETSLSGKAIGKRLRTEVLISLDTSNDDMI